MTNAEYALLNRADYSSLSCIRRLYKNQDSLSQLAATGNTVASCLLIDLQNAANNCLTQKQRLYTDMVLIQGYKISDVATKYGITSATVCEIIGKAIQNMRDYLQDDDY